VDAVQESHMSLLVIWDFDGPMFNSREPRDIAFKRTQEECAQSIEALRSCSFDVSTVPLYDPRRLIHLAYTDTGLASDVLEKIVMRYREHLNSAEEQQQLVPGIRATLENLTQAKCKLAILSSRSKEGLENRLLRLGVRGFFSVVHGRETAKKPSPEVVGTIIKETGASPEGSILVGDSDHDMLTAQQAGIPYFHAGWSNEPAALARAHAEQILHSPSDIEIIVIQGFEPFPSDTSDRNRLTDIARSGRFSFFAGAGVSIPSGLGDWASCYLPHLKKHLPMSALSRFSLPEIVQMIVASDEPAQTLFDDFNKNFTEVKEPNAYHYAIMRSACGTVWTTNYDDLFERVQVFSKKPQLVRQDVELVDHFGSDRKLIKVNGDFYSARFQPKSLDWGVIVSDEQFDLSEVQRPEIWRYFEDEYRTSSLIFVGVSFSDPTLRRILSIISRKVMRTRNPHFVLAVAPKAPHERLIVQQQMRVLRRRKIYTLLFPGFDEIVEFVSKLSILSRRPVIGFTGVTYRVDAPPSASEMTERKLPGGMLSLQEIDQVCGRMGELLARSGLRIASGHGAGVGVPAVTKAYEADRRSARYYMRSRGETQASRSAPAIYIEGGDLNVVRRRLIEAALALVAVGGDREGRESGTFAEIKLAIEMGRPVILFRQGGGVVYACYDELMHLVALSRMAPELRDQVLSLNQRINEINEPLQVRDFIEKEFLSCMHSLVRRTLENGYTPLFDKSCNAADEDW
jgi:HAD superfamily hydrolase (TIGR01549 family)